MHPTIHAATAPEKQACILGETGEALSYRELDRLANQGAHLLRSLGLKRGDVVAVVLENGFDIFTIAWATERAGLYLTCLSTKASPNDIAYIVRDSGARVLIVSDSLTELGELAADRLSDTNVTVLYSGPARTSFTELRTLEQDTTIADESPGGDMLYSSGTTGRPKGVKPPLPTGPLGQETALMTMGRNLYGMGDDTVYLSTSPLYHAAPLRWALTVQRLGGTVVIMEKFDAEQAQALVERYRITHATWVPTHFVRLLKLPEEVRAGYGHQTLRAAIHAAGPCAIPIKRAMIDWWGPIVHEYYSGTEMCGITAIQADEWMEKTGSVGRAILGTLKIVGSDGNELPAGEIGDIYFADGPTFEYHNDPEKTRLAHNARGWATLGDIGRVDKDGYLYLTDRKSFMIICGGVNIYPQEIENVLIGHPEVDDVAVIGVPDEEMGERVMAVVKPSDSSVAGADLAERLRRFVRDALGGVKCPQRFVFRDDLPREPTGKLAKWKLRDEYRDAAVVNP
ncbi:acyl-CoA synthetase [Burkholderia sp. Bp9142]|uniref:acyl-CoA synthetase n=1 Tax=Burkholderia sp. Bp9142 TaxID=2184573 RepID=UPI000F5B5395|nr:acyl-CoA synthetase [Burkholderia sp. Bp9142]RQR33323.1 acyl-CoA synthetase [Burkholderia sp. Bp9142]